RKVFAVLRRLVDVIDVLHDVELAPPHHAPAPAVGAVGRVAAGVRFPADQPGQLPAANGIEAGPEAHAVAKPELLVGRRQAHLPLRAARAGAPRARGVEDAHEALAALVDDR